MNSRQIPHFFPILKLFRVRSFGVIKGTGESTLVKDSPVPLMHHDPDRSWITDPDPDHPKGMQP